MPVVFNVINRPASQLPADASVVVELVGENGRRVAGYVPTLDVTIEGAHRPAVVAATFRWEATLVANSLIEPANTVYKATERVDDITVTHYFTVPATGGPYYVLDILDEVPGALPSPPLTDHINNTVGAHAATAISAAPHSTIAGTTAQAQLEEIHSEAAAGLAQEITDRQDADDGLSVQLAAAIQANADLAASLEVIDGGGVVSPSPAVDSTPQSRWADARDEGNAIVAFVGDSITACSLNDINDGWPARLIELLRADYQPVGVDAGPSLNYVPAYHNQDLTGWDFVGGTTAFSYGLGRAAYQMAGSGDTMTFTFTGTAVDVFYTRQPSGGTATVTIDGGAVASISFAGAARNAEVAAYTGLTDDEHVLVLTWVSGSNIVEGAAVYRDDAADGVRGVLAAKGSWPASTFATPGSTQWTAGFADLLPQIVFVMLGVNDRNNDYNPTGSEWYAFNQSLPVVIARIRAACAIEPLIVVCNSWQTEVAHMFPWDDYEAVIEDVVAGDPTLSYLDFRAVMGDVADAPPGRFIDATHPDVAGYVLMAQAAYDHVVAL